MIIQQRTLSRVSKWIAFGLNLLSIVFLETACTFVGGAGGHGEVTPSVTVVQEPGSNEVSQPTITTPSSNPFYSNGSSVTIGGRCTSGQTVKLNGANTASTSCSNESYSFTLSQSADATYSYLVHQVSSSFVESLTTSFTWIRDTVAPAAPTITTPASNPYVTASHSTTVSGVCESNATVTLAGADSQTTTCSGNSYSFIITETTDGTYNFTLTQIDLASNTSSATTFTITRVSTVPSSPTITSPTPNPYYSNGDSITISGACTNGLTLNLSGDSVQTTTCASSSYSFTVNKSVDNSYNFSVLQTNGALDSANVSLTWIRDTSAPVPPTVTTPASNPYTSADSTITIGGACENNATVNLTGASTQSVTCASSTYRFSVSKSSDATYSFSLSQTDRASNVSSSTDFQWIRDTSIPSTPVILTPAANPYYSNSNSITLTGSCTTGLTVTLGGSTADTMVCASSAFSFTTTKNSDATYLFTVKQTSVTGIDSAQANKTWIRDTVAPSTPTITTPATTPYTSAGNLTISGACENSATVALSGDDTQFATCTSSTYSFTISESDGTYTYNINQTDLAGNISGTVAQVWTRNTSVPPTPTITTPATSPYYSNGSSITVAGGCQTGNVVTLGGNVVAGDVTSPAGSLTLTCASSAYSFTIAKSSDSSYSFTVKQNNGVNNSGTASTTWVRDTTVPNTTIDTNPAASNLSTNASFSFSANEASTTFQCKLDAGSYASCSSPLNYSSLTNGSHTFSVRATDLANNTDASPATYTWTQESYNTLALYHFDTATNAFVDSCSYTGGNNNLLTNSGTTTDSTGKFNQARDHTATLSQFMTAADSSSLDLSTAKMTIDTWCNFTTLPGNGTYQTLVSKSGASGQYGWEFKVKRSGSTYYLVFVGSLDGTTRTEVLSTAAPLTSTGFHHFAVTWDQGTIKFFYEGTQYGSGSIGVVGSARLYDNTTALRIGRSQTGEYLDAQLDELRISQTVRWTSGFTPAPSAYTAD